MNQGTGQTLPADLEVVFVLPDVPVLRTRGWSIPLENLQPADVADILADENDASVQLRALVGQAQSIARKARSPQPADDSAGPRDLLPIALGARRGVVVLTSHSSTIRIAGDRWNPGDWQIIHYASEPAAPATEAPIEMPIEEVNNRYVYPKQPRWTMSVSRQVYPTVAEQVADVRLVVFAVPDARYEDLFAAVAAYGQFGIPVLPVTFSSAGATVGPLILGGNKTGLIQSRFGDSAQFLDDDAVANLSLFSTGSSAALGNAAWRAIGTEIGRHISAPEDADIARYVRVSESGRCAYHAVDLPTLARSQRLRGALWGMPNFLTVELSDADDLDQVQRHLAEGALLSIDNAFIPEFADTVHRSLDRLTGWKLHETISDNFYFHSHAVYDLAQLDPTLTLLYMICDSEASTRWASGLSGIACTAATTAFPSWYMPGDQTTIHDDRVHDRVLAFIWHLTRDWQPTWGGNLVWCTTGEVLPLTFNTLHLMAVPHGQPHTVMPVSPSAQGKRLCWNGWWKAAQPVAPIDRAKGRTIELCDGRITLRPLPR